MQKAYLILENGTILEGQSFGAIGRSSGELVFHTAAGNASGALTDPGSYGQIVLFTFPQLGNCGIIPEDFEQEHATVSGVVVREVCDTPSNFRASMSVDAYLKQENIVGICGIDTRALTQLLRNNGTLKATISDKLPSPSEETPICPSTKHAVAQLSTTAIQTFSPIGALRHKVAVLDYGMKKSWCAQLRALGCAVTVFPCHTSAEIVLASAPDGIVLAGGPGNPADNPDCIAQIQALFGKVPLFGISLGHQMLALSQGISVSKMAYGHHGSNQAVQDVTGEALYVTTQNHSYVVDSHALPVGVSLRYRNVNDGSCEGLDYPRACSVQFDPEPQGGAAGSDTIWMRFLTMMEEC